MGLVAPQTVSSCRGMGSLRHPFLKVLMAGQTHLWALRKQKLGYLRFVRTMALCAIPCLKRRVPAGALLKSLVKDPMAGEADNTLLFHQHAGIIAAVNVMTRKAHAGCERHMVGTTLSFCHEITVAFAAEIRAFSLEKLLLVGTMRIMTRIAIAIRNRFVGVSFQEPDHGIGVACVAHPLHPVFKHKLEIRAVWIMTGCAHALCKGHMGHLCALGLLCFCVAPKAQFSALRVEKAFILCCMRKMTGKASLVADDRCMLERHSLALRWMTVQADGIAGLAQKLCAFR